MVTLSKYNVHDTLITFMICSYEVQEVSRKSYEQDGELRVLLKTFAREMVFILLKGLTCILVMFGFVAFWS